MLESLNAIQQYKLGNRDALKDNNWLKYIVITKENQINLGNVKSLSDISQNPVLDYVQKTLEVLKEMDLLFEKKKMIEEVLIWSEVAKCGSPSQRKKWLENGYNLYVHNIGSAEIYKNELNNNNSYTQIVSTLIETHGLVGQYLRGESLLSRNKLLYHLVLSGLCTKEDLFEILYHLNKAIIVSLSESLWMSVEQKVIDTITFIVDGHFTNKDNLKERVRKLRYLSIENGENFDADYDRIYDNEKVRFSMDWMLENIDLWYVESALQDFSLDEFTKIFLIIKSNINLNHVNHINFHTLMSEMYYDLNGVKKVNLFKKRIFEKYLSTVSIDEILTNNLPSNPHVSIKVEQKGQYGDTAFFTFVFSSASEKLIDFCVEAEKSGAMFEKAILLLYDFFDLRRDQFDRFHNEETYLSTMNQTTNLKTVILDYVVGEKVVDIGPGGGALLDEIVKRYPTVNALGIDFSKNVVETLNKRIKKGNLKWNVQYGNALDLEDTLTEKVDTIIFCSIIHELYSYIEFNGKKFNHDTVKAALESAFNMLNDGGRIIIRDGIMTEPKDELRIIRFRDSNDMKLLERYAKDFQGRQIKYEVVGRNEVRMNVNDCMEFLYTYTWGEESYAHEVQEQFGYFTPTEYKAFIENVLGEDAEVIVNEHYLQEGYTLALSPKIEFFNEKYEAVPLPDSTSLIVIEKRID